jgi:hypothetical protein
LLKATTSTTNQIKHSNSNERKAPFLAFSQFPIISLSAYIFFVTPVNLPEAAAQLTQFDLFLFVFLFLLLRAIQTTFKQKEKNVENFLFFITSECSIKEIFIFILVRFPQHYFDFGIFWVRSGNDGAFSTYKFLSCIK